MFSENHPHLILEAFAEKGCELGRPPDCVMEDLRNGSPYNYDETDQGYSCRICGLEVLGLQFEDQPNPDRDEEGRILPMHTIGESGAQRGRKASFTGIMDAGGILQMDSTAIAFAREQHRRGIENNLHKGRGLRALAAASLYLGVVDSSKPIQMKSVVKAVNQVSFFSGGPTTVKAANRVLKQGVSSGALALKDLSVKDLLKRYVSENPLYPETEKRAYQLGETKGHIKQIAAGSVYLACKESPHRKENRITMKEIALELGTSRKTVSLGVKAIRGGRVLSNPSSRPQFSKHELEVLRRTR